MTKITRLIIRAACLSIAGVGALPFPSVAQDYSVCLTDKRSKWRIEDIPRRGFENYYVVPDPDDKDQRLGHAIISGLELEGLAVSSGPLDQIPAGTQILVTFETKWVWDFRDKLHESAIFFRDASTHSVLLVATQFRTAGLATMPTAEIARMVNRLNSDDLATPLCWSAQSDE